MLPMPTLGWISKDKVVNHYLVVPYHIKGGMNIDLTYNTGVDYVYKDDYRDNIENYIFLLSVK